MSNEVKLGVYMTTGSEYNKRLREILYMVERLLPNGEIKVTTPDMQGLERIVAEKDAEIERLRTYAQHRADCICRSGVLQYSDDCDCGLADIERGEE